MLLLLLQQISQIANPIDRVSQAYLNLYVRMIEFLPQLVAALIILFVTAILARIVRGTVRTAMERTKAEPNIRFVVVRSASVIIWISGIAVMLGTLNINLVGVTAALGLTGAAIGFAIHDIIGNFIAGVVLLSIRPFKLGDTISIDVHEGVVERIEVRVTVLKTSEGKEVSIPNAKVFSSIIVNHSTQNLRRVVFTVGVSYETSFETVQDIILGAINEVVGVAVSPGPEVSVSSFAANIVTLEITCWVEQSMKLGAVASQVKMKVREALAGAHIEVAPAASMTLVRASRAIARRSEA